MTRHWRWIAIVLGLGCWTIGDGHAIGINAPISSNAKLLITLVGWPYIIDGIRVWRGHSSFMLALHRIAFKVIAAVAALVGLVWLVLWLYDAVSLKAMVALGLSAALVLLYFILRELQRRRTE